jgi:hypothetical protein
MEEDMKKNLLSYEEEPMFKIRLLFIFIITLSFVFAQLDNWIYRYNGTGNGNDIAYSITYGADNNIYSAGCSFGSSTLMDFTVIGLTPSGDELWVYTYDGPVDSADVANAITFGLDGNIYAAGYSRGNGTGNDFVVISLTTAGHERWVYRYNGPGNSDDIANAIVFGADGNIYAAGNSRGVGTSRDLTVICLDTSGVAKWVFRYDSSAAYPQPENANAIAYGSDDNLYIAGYTNDMNSSDKYAVMSVDTSGNKRWLRQHGYNDGHDEAYSIAYGLDGNIYSAGCVSPLSYFFEESYNSVGATRWSYMHLALGSGSAHSIIYGLDGNVYAAGDCGNYPQMDFFVVSRTPAGDSNWLYKYNGSGNSGDRANSIVYGFDGNIHAAGYLNVSGSGEDFTMISLSTEGMARRIYTYNGPGNGNDHANAIVCGSDSRLYSAGYIFDSTTNQDFTVIGLNSIIGIQENPKIFIPKKAETQIYPNPFRDKVNIKCHAEEFQIKIYNVKGQVIWESKKPGTIFVWDGRDDSGKDLSAGIYFIRLDTEDHSEIKKVILVR